MGLTVQAGIVGLTRRKKELIEDTQIFNVLNGDKTVPLYSANKQQTRYYRKVKQKEYPLSLRSDLINLRWAKAFWLKVMRIRRHYPWLRRRLQERSLIQVVKRVGSKERRAVKPSSTESAKG